MPTETPTQTYQGMFRLKKPIHIWTPDGGYNAPRLIATAMTPPSMDFEQAAEYLRKQSPRQRHLTFGESFQAMLALEGDEEGMTIAEDMVAGVYERTGTIAVFKGARKSDDGSFYHGCVVQTPLFDADGHMISENGIPKGRDSWEMALPAKNGYAKDLPKDCDTFLNTVYGMEGARKKLPGNAFVLAWPEGELNNLLRGSWSCGRRENRRVYANGDWGPSDSIEDVASRGASDNARFVNKLNDAVYAASTEALLKELEQAPPEQAAPIIDRINKQLNGALVWEDI